MSKKSINIILGASRDTSDQTFKDNLLSYLLNNKIISSVYDVCINPNKINMKEYTAHIDEVCSKIKSSSVPNTYGILVSRDAIHTNYLANKKDNINCSLVVDFDDMKLPLNNSVNCFSIDSRYSSIENCAKIIKFSFKNSV